jgi:YVTN family beta-propeller protein
VLLQSCTPEEPFIDSFSDSWRLIVADDSPGMRLAMMPIGTISNDQFYSSATGSPLTDTITSVLAYRDQLFLLHSSSTGIDVVHRDSLKLVATINVAPLAAAHDFAFANATTAYSTHPNDSVVAVIDLTTFAVVRTIPCGTRPLGIAVTGNQVFVADQVTNQVHVIDTRTNLVTASLPSVIAPTFVEADPANDQVLVVGLGAGKLDDAPKTTPQAVFIQGATKTVSAAIDLTARSADGPTQVPVGLAITLTENAFVPVSNALLRISTRTKNRAVAAQFTSLSSIAYNPLRAEVLLVGADRRTVETWDEFVTERRGRVTLSAPVVALRGIAP